jgi:ATP-binding cassette subfamily B protein
VLAGATTESLRNIELIKSLGLTNQEVIRLNDATQKILELRINQSKKDKKYCFCTRYFGEFSASSILFSLLYLIFQNEINVGQLMTLQFYSFFVFQSVAGNGKCDYELSRS